MTDIVFLGTPDFAVPSLNALLEHGHTVKAVFTQPDRPKGRGGRMTASPVKEFALAHSIPVFQPDKIRREENAAILEGLKPRLMVTAAFGQILSQRNLDAAPLGCVNVHGSLLPAYRGSSPIQWAVMNGEKKTGITTMYTALGVDSGDIILQRETDILPEETAGELFDRLAVMGAEVLVETVELIEQGKAPRRAQEEAKATHFPMLDKDTARLDFSLPVQALHDRIRGLNPWPVAWCLCGDLPLKVFASAAAGSAGSAAPGTVLAADTKNGLVVAAGDGAIALTVIQIPGKRPMDAREFFRGNSLPAGVLTHG